MAIRIEHVESELKTILDKWAEDFKPTETKEHLFAYDWFLDPVKGKVIFRLYVSDDPELKLPSLGTGGK